MQNTRLYENVLEIQIQYRVHRLGEEENFILKFNEDIIADNDEDGEFFVGKATRYLFLLEEAHEAGYPIFDIFDSST